MYNQALLSNDGQIPNIHGLFGIAQYLDKDSMANKQFTIGRPVKVAGVALHDGQNSVVEILPAGLGHGVQFLVNGQSISAQFDNVVQSPLCTMLKNANNMAVSTVEHLLSALYGLNIDNVLIRTDNGELPILDGSALDWVKYISAAGFVEQQGPRQYLQINKMVRVDNGDSFVEIHPYNGFKMDYTIEYKNPHIGRQQLVLEVTPQSFQTELMRARTFCLLAEVEYMRANNKAKGGDLSNAIVYDDNGVMNPEGLRYPDECVRHKMLDAVGDLALAGYMILGHYIGFKSGHALNNNLLRAIFANRSNYELVTWP